MTPQRLAEIEERVKAATEGPWVAEELDGYITGHVTSKHKNWAGNRAPHQRRDSITDCDAMTNTDAAFIAHARQDIPDLLVYVQWLKEELEKCEARHD